MMRRHIWLAAGTCAVLVGAPAQSAPNGEKEAVEAVRLAADRIDRDYVDAGIGHAVAAALRKKVPALRRRGEQGEAFTRDLTAMLQGLSADPHFRFGYSAEAMPTDIFAAKTVGDAEMAAARTARINNYGVLRAERLPGNIGFLDLDQFTDPSLMRRPLAAAMELLKHCDALIVDLRYNSGGFARGAALVASYFLPEEPQRLLVTLQTRTPGQSMEIRTEGPLEAERFLDRPVFLLTGTGTFSAAEMLASSLQSVGRAVIVGARTRGGGNPVARVRLTPHYALLLPTTRGLTPGGKGWEGVGITPDIPADERGTLAAARRAALKALLAQRPGDMLADTWRTLLTETTSATTAGAQPVPGDSR
jgi:hypothetical protein